MWAEGGHHGMLKVKVVVAMRMLVGRRDVGSIVGSEQTAY